MRTVDIPGGQAVLREPSDLKVKQRRMVELASWAAEGVLDKVAKQKAAKQPVNISNAEAQAMLTVQDTVIVALLDTWTLDDSIPANVEQVGEMNADVYEALIEATKVGGAELVAQATVDFSPNPDQSTPSGPSGASGTRLRAEEAKSTRKSSTSGKRTGTGRSTKG